MELFQAENIAGGTGHVSPGSQGHTAQEVKSDPDPPGIVVIQVGDRTDPFGKSKMVTYQPPISRMMPVITLKGVKSEFVPAGRLMPFIPSPVSG